MRKKSVRFVVCVNNNGYASSLERGKLYRLIHDEEAAAEGLVRITDESGEDYAFDAERFLAIKLPERVQAALMTTDIKARKSNVTITRAKKNRSAVRELRLNRERELRRNR